MPAPSTTPVVAVLAGGRGERMGTSKPAALLAGRPLISYALAAAREAGLEALVIAKPDTVLPPLQERVVHDHAQLHHPLAGILAAIEQRESVIALACDMPFVPAALLRWFADHRASSIVTRASGFVQPFPARYHAGQAQSLRESMLAQRSLQASLLQLDPELVDDHRLPVVGLPTRLYFSVNTPTDLTTAEGWLSELPLAPAQRPAPARRPSPVR